jgi:tripartite-type tricarboxylate transporter receptor subunit TctC
MECWQGRPAEAIVPSVKIQIVFVRIVAALCLTLVAPPSLIAQAWPSRTITLVVPFAAGGGTDAIARVLAERLAARLGQPVVVENRAGAASAIGTASAAKAPADGYTLLMTTNSAQVILPLTQPASSLNYDPLQDFSPVGLTAVLPNLLIVSPKVPAKDVAEFITYAKQRPGQLSFASSGNGAITHLIAELFNARAGIDAAHVPYRTGVQAAPDVMEGRIHYQFDNIIWTLPMIRAGQLKGLAITTLQRSALAPEIPTVAESGVPGFEGISWLGLVAPAKTPEPVIARLNEHLTAILSEPDVVNRMAAAGAEPPKTPGPAGYRALLASDTARWKAILSEGKIKLQ